MTDNMRIWNAVEKTDPAHTKHVAQRGGFTAIGANYQIMQATKQFGPVGIGWGYETGQPFFHETLMFVPVTLWHGDRSNTFGPQIGCEEWKNNKGYLDSDVSKKATTDALTKLLSHLGFSADVFLGKYDDQKYVDSLKQEFAEKPAMIDSAQISDLQGMIEGFGLNLGEVLKAFNVPRICDVPAEHYSNAVKILNKLADKKIQQKEAA